MAYLHTAYTFMSNGSRVIGDVRDRDIQSRIASRSYTNPSEALTGSVHSSWRIGHSILDAMRGRDWNGIRDGHAASSTFRAESDTVVRMCVRIKSNRDLSSRVMEERWRSIGIPLLTHTISFNKG